jgi:hypothetical protein
MDASQDEDLEAAVGAALSELAQHLGGTSDTGGPVVNATQIKGRGELGVLLTDDRDYVLGRVWVAFGGAVDAPGFDFSNGGAVHVQAEVCSEVVDPPRSIDEWLAGQ